MSFWRDGFPRRRRNRKSKSEPNVVRAAAKKTGAEPLRIWR